MQPDPMRVAEPVAAAARLLIRLDRHPTQRDFDFDRGLRECERERDVERFLAQRGGLYDAVLDVHPRQLVVQRHDRDDARAAIECPLGDEAHADAGQALAPALAELCLSDLQLRRILQVVTIAAGPQRAALAAGDVQELIERSEEHTSELQSRFGISYAV